MPRGAAFCRLLALGGMLHRDTFAVWAARGPFPLRTCLLSQILRQAPIIEGLHYSFNDLFLNLLHSQVVL